MKRRATEIGKENSKQMKTNRLLFGSLTVAAIFALSSCSTSRQVAYKDDVYNNQSKAPKDYQSPDYYYTDGQTQEQEEQYLENEYYADEYSDEEYVEGYNYDENLEYANRINR